MYRNKDEKNNLYYLTFSELCLKNRNPLSASWQLFVISKRKNTLNSREKHLFGNVCIICRKKLISKIHIIIQISFTYLHHINNEHVLFAWPTIAYL